MGLCNVPVPGGVPGVVKLVGAVGLPFICLFLNSYKTGVAQADGSLAKVRRGITDIFYRHSWLAKLQSRIAHPREGREMRRHDLGLRLELASKKRHPQLVRNE